MTGDELRAARKRLGLSRRQLSGSAELHPDTVRYWEKNGRLDLKGRPSSRGWVKSLQAAVYRPARVTRKHKPEQKKIFRGNAAKVASISATTMRIASGTVDSPRHRGNGRCVSGADERAEIASAELGQDAVHVADHVCAVLGVLRLRGHRLNIRNHLLR